LHTLRCQIGPSAQQQPALDFHHARIRPPFRKNSARRTSSMASLACCMMWNSRVPRELARCSLVWQFPSCAAIRSARGRLGLLGALPPFLPSVAAPHTPTPLLMKSEGRSPRTSGCHRSIPVHAAPGSRLTGSRDTNRCVESFGPVAVPRGPYLELLRNSGEKQQLPRIRHRFFFTSLSRPFEARAAEGLPR
jgi:hypothetical protein